ncbi:MAG: hypothetical protein ACJ75P_13250 [Gaiellaceae bacterium]
MSAFENARSGDSEATATRGEPLAAQPAAGVELVRNLSRTAGNQAVSALLQRDGSATAAPASGAQTTWAQVQSDLSFSKYGWEAMGILKDNNISLSFKTDPKDAVAGYIPATNSAFVNLAMPAYEVAAYFVHEMYHASQFHGKRSPKATSMKEGPWVKTLVDEEIDGTVKGFMHKLALERWGRPQNDKPAGMARFRSAYTYGYKLAIEAGKDPITARGEGIERGRRMVEWMMKRPSRGTTPDLGPNKFDTYDEYYRREWQDTNRKP